MEKMLSRTQVAELLGVSVFTVDRLASEKKLKRYKVGRLPRYYASDVETYLNSMSDKPLRVPQPTYGRTRKGNPKVVDF